MPHPTFAVLFLMATAMVISVANAQDNCSTLNCPVDAPCTQGAPDFSSHWAIAIAAENSNAHCACPVGWTGIRCDVKYESCNDDHSCYHGGKCIPGLEDQFGNEQLFCDCTSAVGEDGTHYVGKHCETAFDQSCGDDEGLFCVNKGECNPNYESDGVLCNCHHGWEGYHCEFKTGRVPDCTLDCHNGGTCVVGVRNPAEAEHYHRAWSQFDFDSHQRCLCPPGFGGPQCDSSSEQCGDADMCYHGGSCVETTVVGDDGTSTSTKLNCDCTTAGDADGNLYAGPFCQFVSNDICSTTDENLFCVNGGTCNEDDATQGCDCPPGYDGFKCDIVDKTKHNGGNTKNEDEDAELCGGIYCLNGGKCVDEEFTTDNGETAKRQVCDCTDAIGDEDGFFAGPACQYKATDICIGGATTSFCVNEGVCNPENGGCDCHAGWTGESCELPSLLENRDPEEPTCGPDGNICLHGGRCVEKQVVLADGTDEMHYHCECTQAYDSKYLYAGDSCQHPSTDLCTRPAEGESLRGQLFCVNHGTCNDNILLGCDCPVGFEGFRCEYETVDEDPNEVTEDDFPDVERCGNDLICHNGGRCVTTKTTTPDGRDQIINHCDCDTASTETAVFAGPECQYQATTFCHLPRDSHDLEWEQNIFCVNGGTCRENVLEGCDCPAGWSGLSCEIVGDRDVDDYNNDADFDSADFNFEVCGDVGVCLNGGVCASTTQVNDGGEHITTQYCDCSEAYTEDAIFAGPQCEFRSTTFCTAPPEAGTSSDLSGVMFCVNGGTCEENVLQGCSCPPAWTGFRCEVQVEHEDVLDDDTTYVTDYVPCGEEYCYHGGVCVKGEVNGVELDTCDCSTALTETERYAGKYCQYKSTTFCTDEADGNDISLIEFCTNGGECSYDGCHCPTGYTGERCEYTLYVDQEDSEDNIVPDDGDYFDDDWEECFLECKNNGSCAKGAKDLTNLEASFQYVDHLNKAYSDDFFEHCICPEGWIGLQCEHKAEICGENEHVCLHGSTCVKNGKNGYGCDCSTTNEKINKHLKEQGGDHPLFAGDSCQHPVTDICMSDDDYPGRPLYFCVNYGTCLDYVTVDDDFPGCECREGWDGDHCEEPATSIVKDTAKKGGWIVLYVILCLAGIALIYFAIMTFLHRRGERNRTNIPLLRSRRRQSMRRFMVDPNAQNSNFAPQRNKSKSPSRTFNSSSDPMITGISLAPDEDPAASAASSFSDEPGDEPEMGEDNDAMAIGPVVEDAPDLLNVDLNSSIGGIMENTLLSDTL